MKWIITGIIIFFIAFTIWYHIPTKHIQEYSFSTFKDEEKTVSLLLNVKKHKKFFQPTVLTGELIYNDHIFNSAEVTNGNSWIYKLKQKLDGELGPTLFINSTQQGLIVIEREQWYVFSGTDDLKYLNFKYKPNRKDEASQFYVAPAKNREEAIKIMNKIYGFE